MTNGEQLLIKIEFQLNSYDVAMTLCYLYDFIDINLADINRFFGIELERAYKELSKNALFVNFHQLNGKLWLVLYFLL